MYGGRDWTLICAIEDPGDAVRGSGTMTRLRRSFVWLVVVLLVFVLVATLLVDATA